MTHRLSLFVLSLLLASVAVATKQYPELIVIDGQQYDLLSVPLESYLDEHELEVASSSGSSALWRGYVGSWRIEAGTLELVSLHDCDYEYPSELGAELKTDGVFPGQELPLKAEWFSGVLRVREGDEIVYVHMGFDSIYSIERFILIENGRIVRDWRADRTAQEGGRSTLDLVRATKGDPDVEDHLRWVDLRELVQESEAQYHVVTRGVIVFSDTDAKWYLGVPRSYRHPSVYMELRCRQAVLSPEDQAIVEVEGELLVSDDSRVLVVKKLSKLAPGQTIHHPDYSEHELQSGRHRNDL